MIGGFKVKATSTLPALCLLLDDGGCAIYIEPLLLQRLGGGKRSALPSTNSGENDRRGAD